jgi:hypothetical protein
MSITKSQTEKIGSIFSGNRFIIPTYQRKYSWTDHERKALWKDIEESLNDNMNHFVGTLSFKENKNVGLSTVMTYEVIDGQQRITTLFILLSVLIDKIKDETIQENQRNAYIGTANNLKLFPLGDDGEFLKRILFDFTNIDFSKVDRRSQMLMYSAKKEFLAFVNPLSPTEIEQRIIFILERIEVLVFNVESQAQAVKMFSIINDRGLPLRILDKTKSILMLFSTLHLEEKSNDLINNEFEKIFDSYDDILVWKDKLGILGRFEENTLFTHHYYSSKRLFPGTWNIRDGAETIFDNLKYRCEELKDDPKELEKFIGDYTNDFEKFATGYSNLIKDIKKVKEYEKPFRYLQFTATLYPLIVRLYLQNKLNDLLGILEAIEIRVYKIGTKPIADVYNLSSYISENETSVLQIRNSLIALNERFMNDYNFRNLLSTNISENGAVKYILSEYGKENHDINIYNTFQKEHIFSQAPDYDPTHYGFDHDYDYEKHKIGNIALLEERLNKGIGNVPPINKVSGYLSSQSTETRNIAGDIQKGNFTKVNVDERREKIIEFCIEHFKVNIPTIAETNEAQPITAHLQ